MRQVEVEPLEITGVAPDIVCRGETIEVVVTGTGLIGATVTAVDSGLYISSVQSSATEVSFDLEVGETVPLGARPFTLTARCGAETSPETRRRFFIDTRLGCPVVA